MKKVKILFYVLIIYFILVLAQIFIPAIQEMYTGSLLFLVPIFSFSVIGFILVYMVKKYKIQGKIKKYLYLVGYSSGFISVGVVVHNLLSGLGILLLKKDFEEPLFFILATLVLPVVFIIASIKTILLFKNDNT